MAFTIHRAATSDASIPAEQAGRQSERTKHKFDLWSPTKGNLVLRVPEGRTKGRPRLKRETNKFTERATQQTHGRTAREPTEDITTVINSAPMTNGDSSHDKTELLYHDSLRFRNLRWDSSSVRYLQHDQDIDPVMGLPANEFHSIMHARSCLPAMDRSASECIVCAQCALCRAAIEICVSLSFFLSFPSSHVGHDLRAPLFPRDLCTFRMLTDCRPLARSPVLQRRLAQSPRRSLLSQPPMFRPAALMF